VCKWDIDSDRRLHRLICYINTTIKRALIAYCGDELRDCRLCLFTDADFAGDRATSRSTSGVCVAIVGPDTYLPLSCLSKKKPCTSASTCEAEILAMTVGLKEALNLVDLWEAVSHVFTPSGPIELSTSARPGTAAKGPINQMRTAKAAKTGQEIGIGALWLEKSERSFQGLRRLYSSLRTTRLPQPSSRRV
jgi:hypothetical protein